MAGQTDRQTGKQADRQTGRQADRQTGRQAERQTDRRQVHNREARQRVRKTKKRGKYSESIPIRQKIREGRYTEKAGGGAEKV